MAKRAADSGKRTLAGQGLLPFGFVAANKPMELTAQAGLILVAETLMALGMEAVVTAELRLRKRRRGLSEYDKLQAIVLLLAAGGECVEDVRVLRQDAALWRLLGREVPSADALHEFLTLFHDEQEMSRRPQKGAFIPSENAALKALGVVNAELIHRAVSGSRPTLATLDLDATIIESHKRGALGHYKGGRGYQPTAVLWAEQDVALADQYRDGNVPAGMNTKEVAQRAFSALPTSVKQRRFRGDSACYDEKLLKWLCQQKIAFTVSADMSPELRAVCMSSTAHWQLFEDRPHEVVSLSEVEFTPGIWPKNAPALRYIALRFSGKQGRLFSDGKETKYLAVVSNRDELSAAELIGWHWEKAGTIEHLHDVTKNDLAGRLPPSGRFGANAAWYRLNLLTYNVLTVLKRHALPERLRSARPKRLRFEVFTVPAVLRTHARQLTAQLGAPPLTVDELVLARGHLRDLHQQIHPVLDGKSA
jgi:hypothetical protein